MNELNWYAKYVYHGQPIILPVYEEAIDDIIDESAIDVIDDQDQKEKEKT